MAPARPADLPQGTPFDAAVIALLYVWVALNATLTVWIETDLAPVASAAGVWAGAGLLFWWTHRGRLALLEFDSGLNVRDRFFVFLAVIGFAAAPALFWDRASAPVVLLALNPPLVVLACKRVHFHRLFCVNLLLTVFVVRALPGFPLALMALEALIVFLLFAADAMAGRAEPGFVAPGQVAAFTIRPALGYYAAALGAMAACWAALPRLRPAWSDLAPRIAPLEMDTSRGLRHAGRRELNELFVDLAIAVAVLLVLVAFLRWWMWKTRGAGKSAATLEAEGRMACIGRERLEAREREARFDLDSPRGRIVYAYNLLLDRLAEKGLAKEDAQTPEDFARMLREKSTAPADAVDRATEIFEAAHYGERDFSEREALEYRATLERIAEQTGALNRP